MKYETVRKINKNKRFSVNQERDFKVMEYKKPFYELLRDKIVAEILDNKYISFTDLKYRINKEINRIVPRLIDGQHNPKHREVYVKILNDILSDLKLFTTRGIHKINGMIYNLLDDVYLMSMEYLGTRLETLKEFTREDLKTLVVNMLISKPLNIARIDKLEHTVHVRLKSVLHNEYITKTIHSSTFEDDLTELDEQIHMYSTSIINEIDRMSDPFKDAIFEHYTILLSILNNTRSGLYDMGLHISSVILGDIIKNTMTIKDRNDEIFKTISVDFNDKPIQQTIRKICSDIL